MIKKFFVFKIRFENFRKINLFLSALLSIYGCKYIKSIIRYKAFRFGLFWISRFCLDVSLINFRLVDFLLSSQGVLFMNVFYVFVECRKQFNGKLIQSSYRGRRICARIADKGSTYTF